MTNFKLLENKKIEALNLTVEVYQHQGTGATHYHLVSDSDENVFMVALRTIPQDSTGVAHMLEHTALCGSERYPVRDPFFMMTRRSLNTFMNAFTSSDWTGYPFASQNKKDFYNLLAVYLDAVFFSRIDPLDFLQEGHRLEFEKIDDPNSELMYKGVVYNEMKGAMSSPVSMLWHTLCTYLYPTTTYHYNSGGDPDSIVDLSYQQLKKFYQTYYHPSNAIFMTFGNIPAKDLQKEFEEKVLVKFPDKTDFSRVTEEKRYYAPISVEEFYPVDEKEKSGNKAHVIVGWLLGKSSDHAEYLQTQLLSNVLLDNSASPLLKALETTDLGSAPSPLCGIEDSNLEMCFICGLEGSKPENADKIEKLIMDVIAQVAEKGVPHEQVESVLYQLEIQQREITGGRYPYGLQLIMQSLPAAIHGGDPIQILDVEPALKELRNKIKDPNYIKNLAKDLLLNNQHRVRLVLKPDPKLAEHRHEALKQKLAKIKSGLSEQEKKQIIDQALQLQKRQNAEHNPDVLPQVTLADVPSEVKVATGVCGKINKSRYCYYPQSTNGLVYHDIIFSLPQLDNRLREMVPFYCELLTELGCGKRDYLANQQYQASIVGGIATSSLLRGQVNDAQIIQGKLIISGKALVTKHQAFFELMHEAVEQARFDELPRMRELIAQYRAQAEQSIVGNGHVLAMQAASSKMSVAANIQHHWYGLAGIHNVEVQDESLQDSQQLEQFAEKLAELHQLVRKAPRELLVIAESAHAENLQQALTQCWQQGEISKKDFTAFSDKPLQEKVGEMWLTSTRVNFCAKAYATVPPNHPDAPVLTVLANFLRNGYLHRAIREQGGAYGGGASHESDIASFRFYSYRDPRLLGTLKDFDQSLIWLQEEKHKWDAIEEAILGVIGTLDKPASPAGEARTAYYNELYGRTKQQRQLFRQRVLAVKLPDLQRVAQQYLQPKNASIAVITNKGNKQEVAEFNLTEHEV